MGYITAESIYQQTNGGLDIFHSWCADSSNAGNKHFRFDESDSKASCMLKLYNGFWWMNNYGESDGSMRAIEVVMKIERASFYEACQLIAKRMNLRTQDDTKKPKFDLPYTAKSASEGEFDGWWKVTTKDFSDDELRLIFSVNTWSFLGRMSDGFINQEQAKEKAIAICKSYNFVSLSSYEYVKFKEIKGEKKLIHATFSNTQNYPIFAYQENEFTKIYQPKGELRFRYFGKLPKNFVHGLAKHSLVYEDKNQLIQADFAQKLERANNGGIEPGDKDYPKEPKPWQHEKLVIVSGGSDGLNIEAMNLPVVWLNSESDIERISDKVLDQLKKVAKNVYILFDLDDAGRKFAHKLNLKHLSLRTAHLPETLSRSYDLKGKHCKDVRDFLNVFGRKELQTVLNNAMPYQFWEETIPLNRDGSMKFVNGEVVKKFVIITTYAINFLAKGGFGKLSIGQDADGVPIYQLIRDKDNVVSRVTGDDMRGFIADFLNTGVYDWRLKEVFSNTAQLSDMQLNKLPTIEADFNDFDEKTQWKTFQTGVFKITKEGIEMIKPENSRVKIWQHEVVKPTNYSEVVRVKSVKLSVSKPMFEIKKDDLGRLRLTILDNSCLFFRFLTNASRTYWREELEDRLEAQITDIEARNNYRQANKFAISGELLDEDQQQEQEQHLINKITLLGYLQHGYKQKSNSIMPWFQDYVMKDSEKSQGGTGKSAAMESLKIMMTTKFVDGRSEEGGLNDKFWLAGVTKHTDFLMIDDPQRNAPINQLFNMITGNMSVRDLGKAPRTIDFHDSPKIGVASNFPPLKLDPSLARRLKFATFSDYYHSNSEKVYREHRKISDDFDKDLFSHFTEAEWNYYFNFMAQCTQAYMSVGIVETPGENVLMNTIRNEIGQEFIEWAEMYFDPLSNRLDTYCRRKPIFQDYEKSVKYSCGDRKFKEKIRQWCVLKGFKLNPIECAGYRNDVEHGRITLSAYPIFIDRGNDWKSGAKKEAIEFFYIQSVPDNTIADFVDDYDEHNKVTETLTEVQNIF